MRTTASNLTRKQSPVFPEKRPGILHIIAVDSGKGGVGQPTVSVNLALVL